MNIKKNKVYCEHCDEYVDYTTEISEMIEEIDSYGIKYTGVKTNCKICGERVYVDEIEDRNREKINAQYRKKIGIISTEEINSILDKYDIGATVLPIILDWGKLTISRYLKGCMPTRKYSDELYAILNDPKKMLELVESKKEELNGIAYKKAMIKIKKLIQEESQIKHKIENVALYIYKLHDKITYEKMQTILFFIQGYGFAFGETIFRDRPTADRDLIIYRNITKFRDEKILESYMNIPMIEIEKDLSDAEKEIIEVVSKYYNNVSYSFLFKLIKLSEPWKKARVYYDNDQECDNEIYLDDIEKYFKELKNKYKMLDIYDVKDYLINKLREE